MFLAQIEYYLQTTMFKVLSIFIISTTVLHYFVPYMTADKSGTSETVNSCIIRLSNVTTLLKTILKRNGYMQNFVDSCVARFLNKLYVTKQRMPSCSLKPVTVVLPYIGINSIHVKDRIYKLCKKFFPQVSCRVVFSSNCRLSSHFPYKDPTPKALRALVVYNFQCSSCNATYIGKTYRHLLTRVSEHAGVSDRTGKVRKDPEHTAVYKHFLDSKHSRPCLNDFSVLSSARYDSHLKIKESLLIADLKPCLNHKIASDPLLLF